jgi:uncharacterized membrane protein YphA (DoxX/SURF4 family)
MEKQQNAGRKMNGGRLNRKSLEKFFTNEILILSVRIFLGAVFVLSSIDKISDPSAFASSILNYKIVGPDTAMLVSSILPYLELICGLCLIIGLYTRAGALLITSMLIVFTILIISALARGLDISCGCFSQDPDAGKIGFKKISENLGMIILGVYLLIVQTTGFSIIDNSEKLIKRK